MERIAQLLDDLDDLVYMIRSSREQIRRFLIMFLLVPLAIAVPVGGVALALSHPPLALATALILFVALLYHTVTTPPLEISR